MRTFSFCPGCAQNEAEFNKFFEWRRHYRVHSFISEPGILVIFRFYRPQGPSMNHFGFSVFTYKSFSRTASQILKIRPHSRLQIQFSITFILCKFTIFLLFRVLNYKKKTFLDNPRPGQFRIQIMLLSLTFKDLQILL